MPQIRNFGDSLLLSLHQAMVGMFGFIPILIGALLILAIGWIVSNVVARLVDRLLVRVGFERVVHRAGVAEFMAKSGTHSSGSSIIAGLVKWLVRLVFILAASNALGMPQVTAIINSIFLFIPKLIVALVILVIGAQIANALSKLVLGSGSLTLSLVTRYAVLGFAVIAALSHLEIAPVIVNTLFIGLVASLSLAAGLAFGLGGRDVASGITRCIFEKSKLSGPTGTVKMKSSQEKTGT